MVSPDFGCAAASPIEATKTKAAADHAQKSHFSREVREAAINVIATGASPVHHYVGQQIEGTPGLRCKDHWRGIIRVAEPDASANSGRNGSIIGGGDRIIAGMSKLAALQGGIDHKVAEDISGGNHGHHVSRPGRQK